MDCVIAPQNPTCKRLGLKHSHSIYCWTRRGHMHSKIEEYAEVNVVLRRHAERRRAPRIAKELRC
jgi:hypothetical protein